MQIVRLLIAGIALVFGLIFTLAIAAVGIVLFCIQRLLGRPGSTASFKVNFQRDPSAPQHSRPTRMARMARDGAIDIEATEVKIDTPPKQRLEG
jgi:hypothetical protein